MKTNKKTPVAPVVTHQNGPAKRNTALQELERAVMSCFLWENNFYESGVSVAERIKALVPKVNASKVAQLAIKARNEGKLRHVPLLLVREMARYDTHKPYVAETLENIIQRPDELGEFLSLYWADGRCPLANSVKKGLGNAFTKFSEYALAKYNRDVDVKLRDVLFLTHPKPVDKKQEATWKKLANNELAVPDTWEVELSKGGDKKGSWTRLLEENKLGALALIRNLRNMNDAGVSRDLIKNALQKCNPEKVLPFRFISAAKYAPNLEPELESLMFKSIPEYKLKGRTVLLIDVSGSMTSGLSGKSELSRIEAANALAILLREVCEDVVVYTFSTRDKLVPARRGFALKDAIMAQFGGSTKLKAAMESINAKEKYDRMVIISDEESEDGIGKINNLGYMINVASYQNGVNYNKNVTHINGFSENVVNFIIENEKELDTLEQ